MCRYVFGVTHIPRLEDWPVMPVANMWLSLMVSDSCLNIFYSWLWFGSIMDKHCSLIPAAEVAPAALYIGKLDVNEKLMRYEMNIGKLQCSLLVLVIQLRVFICCLGFINDHSTKFKGIIRPYNWSDCLSNVSYSKIIFKRKTLKWSTTFFCYCF